MARAVAVGAQNFEDIVTKNCFYIDKTRFIKEWWESEDVVTLIISKESMFSDLNNLRVVTLTSDEYAPYFGFTEEEVFDAMDEFGMVNKEEVKKWYDGFTIGSLRDIYNPWSVINFLKEGKLKTYWANTSSNGLVSSLIKTGDNHIKMQFEELLRNHPIVCEIDEEIVYEQLEQDGEAMNEYMGCMALTMFSSFDGGTHPSEVTMPERFYHGFVLGLLVELADRYEVTSNRESGFGRYDVMLKPLDKQGDAITDSREKDDAIIMEFKVYNPKKESSLEETVQAALNQIEKMRYEETLLAQGIEKGCIRKYGFAFAGKRVLVGE